ncbi:MAG TPA: tetratricopeptide repeat protein, partial [Kofleriaceae bacterium]
DRSALDATPALEALLAATHLENQLWRAHYYIGRILGDRGDARAAAEQLTLAIAQHAWEPGPYIALAELYRRWRYRDEALAIAEIGTAAVPDSADLWYELGAARDDRGEPGEAISAFTRALDLEPGLAAVQFQRGQAYFRVKDFAHARRDLEAFAQTGGRSFELEEAQRMLANLAAPGGHGR